MNGMNLHYKGDFLIMNKKIKTINEWAIQHGLDHARCDLQVMKIYEEVGELSAGVLKLDKLAIQDGIGDVFISVVVLAKQLNIDIRKNNEPVIPYRYNTYNQISDLILDELYPTIASLSQHVQMLRQDDLFDVVDIKQHIKMYILDIILILQRMCEQLMFDFDKVIKDTVELITARSQKRVFNQQHTINMDI